MKQAIETAIKMETDAIAFYQEAAGKTGHPFGREMFLGFVKDEKRHLRMLKELFEKNNVEFEFISPRESIRTVFSQLKDEMMTKAAAAENELEAIKIALHMEKEGFVFYKEAASKATSEQEQKLFERLVEEENEHYAILNKTYEFLDNTGNWYMYEERGILEG